MKESVDDVMNMNVKDFLLRLTHLEAVLAEQRYINQRQLDNHIKIKNKKTINNFGDIYKEFEECMKSISEVKYIEVKYTKEELEKKHEENLAKIFG